MVAATDRPLSTVASSATDRHRYGQRRLLVGVALVGYVSTLVDVYRCPTAAVITLYATYISPVCQVCDVTVVGSQHQQPNYKLMHHVDCWKVNCRRSNTVIRYEKSVFVTGLNTVVYL